MWDRRDHADNLPTPIFDEAIVRFPVFDEDIFQDRIRVADGDVYRLAFARHPPQLASLTVLIGRIEFQLVEHDIPVFVIGRGSSLLVS